MGVLMQQLSNFYPHADSRLVGLLDLPEDAHDEFERLSKRFILPDDYRPGSFEKILRVENLDGSVSFVAFQTKQYPNDQFDNPGSIERLMLIWEKIGDMPCGSGEVRYNITDKRDFFLHKPFIGWTETDPLIIDPRKKTLLRRGYGIRRVRLMHALTMIEYGLPLYSDKGGGKQPLLWRKLVQLGEARKFRMSDYRVRYVMTL